jgi:hypothetical protein
MEGKMKRGNASEPAPLQIPGACGHPQPVVGYRSKKLFTLKGSLEWKRAYSQCQVEADKEATREAEQAQPCSHGRAPADEIWGVQGTRTTPGVQEYISYLCATLTLEEAAATFHRLLPLRMSARQALNADRTRWAGPKPSKKRRWSKPSLRRQASQRREAGASSSPEPPR